MNGHPALTASYRLQMNAGFTLADARARVDYFATLGISHLYLSPILAARQGSMHGYDVIDPTRVNPELGTEEDLRALSRELHARNMGLIVDIVPNHMGIGKENRYWDDVLTHGEHSRYARWFDIHWAQRDSLHRKLVLPILGDELDRVIERGELAISLHEGATPRVTYFENSFPLDPASLPPDLQLAQVDPEEAGELAAAYSRPENRDAFRALLDAQHYRLVEWQRGTGEINYRRFFDVNDLAALHAEDPVVFEETHAYILRLVRDGVIDGLRIDHIDGLFDPRAYLDRLRAATSADTPIFVEKILSPGETLPDDWPVQGTTGYEFLNTLGDIFLDPDGFRELEAAYLRLRGMQESTFEDTARAGKRKMLSGPLRADVARLADKLAPIARAAGHRWPKERLFNALVEFLSALPVYRTYIAPGAPVRSDDRRVIERALAEAKDEATAEIVAFIGQVLLGDAAARDEQTRMDFVQHLQQLSGPATAKGVEDTALYAYLPLASRNEVGGSPDRPLDGAVDRLHDENRRRGERWPLNLLATNTHDTKRSADVRSRLEALSEMPEDWETCVVRWREMNARHRETVNGRSAPDLNTEYLLYQTLIGLWPASSSGGTDDALPDRSWRESVQERISQYMLKASREAKMRTSWIAPDAPYEEGLRDFVTRILDDRDESGFVRDLAPFARRVVRMGAWNALSRIVVHLTSPGTPDIYQGDELWNYALVDPDNRQPVDYDRRAALIRDVQSIQGCLERGELDLVDDRAKLLVTHQVLELRRRQPETFAQGTYQQLAVRGTRAAHVVAYLRSFGGRHSITIAPRLVRDLVGGASDSWGDTAVELPAEAADVRWQSQIVADNIVVAGTSLAVGSILSKLPVAVLAS